MPAKRATAKSNHAELGLTKADACKLLQVAPNADEELITQAYWHQARKVQPYARFEATARRHLDELNRAYRVLNPGQSQAPLEREMPATRDEAPVTEALTSWMRRLIEETARRWPGRATEVAVLSATIGLLTVLAISAGADLTWTLLATAAAAITIWAPWRRA